MAGVFTVLGAPFGFKHNRGGAWSFPALEPKCHHGRREINEPHSQRGSERSICIDEATEPL